MYVCKLQQVQSPKVRFLLVQPLKARLTTKTIEVETAAPSPGNDEPAGSKSNCSNCFVLQNQNRILQNKIRTLQGHLSRQKNENRKYRRRSGSK